VGDGLPAKLGLGGVGAWVEADLELGTYLGLLEFWGAGVLRILGLHLRILGLLRHSSPPAAPRGGYTPRPTVPNHMG
jgi:hypothetical protein